MTTAFTYNAADYLDEIERVGGEVPEALRKLCGVPGVISDQLAKLAETNAPPPLKLAELLAVTDDPDALVARLVEQAGQDAARHAAHTRLSAALRRGEQNAAAAFRRAAGEELVAALRPVFGRTADALVDLVGRHPVVATMTAEGALAAPDDMRTAYTQARALAGQVDELHLFAAELRGHSRPANERTTEDMYPDVVNWSSVPQDLRDRARGDRARVGSGFGTARPMPTTLEMVAAGGRPALHTLTEARALIEERRATEKANATQRPALLPDPEPAA